MSVMPGPVAGMLQQMQKNPCSCPPHVREKERDGQHSPSGVMLARMVPWDMQQKTYPCEAEGGF